MGWFKRSAKPEAVASTETDQSDLGTLLLQGEDMIEQLALAHASWGLGSADRWGLDQRSGVVTWTFPDRTATAQAQILASYNPSAQSWLWAWANQSILTEMSRDARVVRDWAAAHGHAGPAEAQIAADDEKAATLSIPIITFGPVTLTDQDGATSTFGIDIN
ncbi:DUF6882 domain-containing protein [Streptomyces sp. NPDC059979]|uniref:DUF6882 domain-containing protein n=1 Tax=Streptomyces sp. NPDC059979 TaxID=3347021 RepID=UPI0036AD1310